MDSGTVQIIIAVITSIATVLGVVITNSKSNTERDHKLEVTQKVTETKLTNIEQKVAEHDRLITKVPLLEEKVAVANHRIDDLEQLNKKSA